MRALVNDVNEGGEKLGDVRILPRAAHGGILRPRRFAALAVAVCSATALVAAGAWAADPCTTNCASVRVDDATGPRGGAVTVPVFFEQGADDGRSDEGPDEVAALAFTLGIPGTEAGGTPLSLPCVSPVGGGPDTLASDAITVGELIRDDFRVVVENAECLNRTRCLCPRAGQTRDNFVNVVVYGPKDLDKTPVTIPVLPASTELFSLKLLIASNAPDSIPLHLFNQTEDPCPPSAPQFSACLSIGDESAKDQTVSGSRSQVTYDDGTLTVEAGGPPCPGDCDSTKKVEVNELIAGINIALGKASVGVCDAADINEDDEVTIDELVAAVGSAINGCPGL